VLRGFEALVEKCKILILSQLDEGVTEALRKDEGGSEL